MAIGTIKIGPKTKNHKAIIEAISNKLGGGYVVQEVDDMLIVTSDGPFIEDINIAITSDQIAKSVQSTIIENVIKVRGLLTYTTQFTLKTDNKIVSKMNGLAACALLGQLSAFIVKACK